MVGLLQGGVLAAGQDAVVQWAFLSTQFLAAALMVALAIGLLVLNYRGAVTRAFAFFLLVSAGVIIVLRVVNVTGTGGVFDNPNAYARAQDVLWFFRIAYAPTILAFLLAYVRPSPGIWRWLRWSVLAGLLALEVIWFLHVSGGDRCIAACTMAGPAGPLYVLTSQSGAGTFLAGLAALGFAIASLRRPVGALHSAVFLLSLGFCLNALVDGGASVFGFLQSGLVPGAAPGAATFWAWLTWSLGAMGVACALATLVLYGVDAAQHPELRRLTGTAFGFAAAALATAAYIGLGGSPSNNDSLAILSLLAIGLAGLFRLALPALGALALIKHRLFGIEVKINHGISRSLVVGAFLAVFFVVTQIVQNVFASPGWGILGGGMAAGILLFALQPLQHLGHRIADAIVPAGRRKTTRVAKHEALDLYRDQAMLVWADGVMGRKERAILDQLRDRLAVPHAEAARLEREAADAAPAGRFPARKAKGRMRDPAPIK